MPHSVHSLGGMKTPIEGGGDAVDLSLRYWNANQPRAAWSEECPEFLEGISEKNKVILSKRDEEFDRITWDKCKELQENALRPAADPMIDPGENTIYQFQRNASQLRGYLEYIHHLKKKHGSVLEYVKQFRLKWADITSSGKPPFEDASDFKILYNDWPYHVDEDITHLVIWTKFTIDEEEQTGEVTPEGKRQTEDFIKKTFLRQGITRDQIIWFKNWKSLKSVHALGDIGEAELGLMVLDNLEHFHVMLYKAPRDLLDEVTRGDRPTSESWTSGTEYSYSVV
ncbi:Oxysterol-binding protein OBPa [Exophiala oligosperma]